MKRYVPDSIWALQMLHSVRRFATGTTDAARDLGMSAAAANVALNGFSDAYRNNRPIRHQFVGHKNKGHRRRKRAAASAASIANRRAFVRRQKRRKKRKQLNAQSQTGTP